MSNKKEPYKAMVENKYLGAYSLDDGDGGYIEVQGVVINAKKAEVVSEKGTSTGCVANTSLGKPFVVNTENASVLQLITGSRYPADWNNVPVTFWVKKGVKAFGKTTDGLRIKVRKSTPRDYAIEKQHLQACTTLEELQTAYLSIDRSAQQALVLLKDEMKAKLTPKNE